MIPLIACRPYSPEDALIAAVLVGISMALGWSASKSATRNWFHVTMLLALYMPFAAILGIWPFDPQWRHDCGATPDPNILPIGAALLFPFMQVTAYLASRWWARRHR